ncbi:MAG: GAF domain-containing protein [Cyanobacteria bacterium P01_A01_bin.40]
MTIQPSLSLSDISANSVLSNSIFTEVFKKLCAIKTGDSSLQAGVEIVYQVLRCDRAVVYSLQTDSYCKIVAEAVTPGYAQTLGTTIKDPCFEAGYIEKYRRGRVRAITDIYQSGINPCHIESLENIDVKSNLVVPMVRSDNSLYGLLVMHQCSGTRKWQQSEVEFVLQVANWMIEELSQQAVNSAWEAQVTEMRQTRELINQATLNIHRAKTSSEVLQQGVTQSQAMLKCDRVVVYCLQEQQMGKIVAEATTPALASILGSVIKDPCFEYRYIDQYQQGRIRSIPNIYEAGMTDCYVENLAKIGVRSNLVVPINWDNGKIYGLLVAHQCFNFKDWQPAEIEYLQDIALHIGLSLSKAQIKEQSQQIETGLEQLDNVKTTVDLAKSKINQIKQPMLDTSQILVEVSNLYKLLEREINQINQSSSVQTKKDTKLIQIITRKLILVTSKLKQSLGMINLNGNEATEILADAIAYIDDTNAKSD